MGLWRRSRERRDESDGLDDPVERIAIDYEIFDDRKRADAKRFDGDRLAVAKFSHVQLAHSARMIGPMSFAVDRKRAGAADPFPAIRVERNWFPTGTN